MKKRVNAIIPDPQYPCLIYHQPLRQPRLFAKSMLIHRDTAYPSDVEFARAAVGHALYWHYEIVMVEAWWKELPATLKRWSIRQGAKITLCGSLKEAWNSADVRWCGDEKAA